MTPGTWAREQLALKRERPKTVEEMGARRAELQESAKAACGAGAVDALLLLRLVWNGVLLESELPE